MQIPAREAEGGTYCCTQDVCDALGVTLSSVFIVNTLKVETDARRRSAYYWAPEKVPVIRDALVAHLKSL